MRTSLRLRITGRVQGVGYRHALSSEALARGISGWVRNRRDGSVEALIQGPAAVVDALLAWARRGPPAARVDRIETQAPEGEDEQALAGFEQRPTA